MRFKGNISKYGTLALEKTAEAGRSFSLSLHRSPGNQFINPSIHRCCSYTLRKWSSLSLKTQHHKEELEQTRPHFLSLDYNLLVLQSIIFLHDSPLFIKLKAKNPQVHLLLWAFISLSRFSCHVKYTLNKCECFCLVNLYHVIGVSAMRVLMGNEKPSCLLYKRQQPQR
jgi:hypothetical protein